MKRSRTCQCLHELDLPKRSRSTPDLGALKRAKEVFGGENFSHNLDVSPRNMEGSLQLLSPVFQPPGLRSASPAPIVGRLSGAEDFVVDSIVRSKGSLNEITILEHEEFIGDESPELGVGIDLGKGTALFDGEPPGHLFDDSGESSDYFYGVDSDEAEEDSTGRSTETGSDEGADEVSVNKVSRQDTEASDTCPEDDALGTEWSTHDHTAQRQSAMPWDKPRGCGAVLSRGPTIGREDLEWRLTCPVPATSSTNGLRTARAFSPVQARTKRSNASPPLCSGVPQERYRDAAPAAPPPHHKTVSSWHMSANNLWANANAGDVPTSRLGGSLVSLPVLSVSTPCLAGVGAYGDEAATARDHVLESEINAHRHRMRLVTGQDMMALLSLERLHLDAKPSRVKMSPDPMW